MRGAHRRMRNAQAGQATTEYFLIFVTVALMTMIGYTTFDQSFKNALQNFYDKVSKAVAQ